MAVSVSVLSNFLFSLLPSKSNVISLSSPASVRLPQTTTTGWAPLVTSWVPKSSYDDVKSVAWPSLAHANVLFFFNVQINVADDEPEEKILRRFRSAVLRAGVIQESKRRRFFESSQEKRKRKARFAAQRNRKRHPRRTPAVHEAPEQSKDGDEDDNWEVPEGDIPYC